MSNEKDINLEDKENRERLKRILLVLDTMPKYPDEWLLHDPIRTCHIEFVERLREAIGGL